MKSYREYRHSEIIASNRSSRKKIITILLTLLLLLLPLFSFKARAETKNLDKNTLLYSAKILKNVIEFRQIAMTDYKEALTKFGSLKVINKFKELDSYIWPVTNPRLSWSYFFNVSVYVFGDVSKKNQVVGFYHPWSDVFLVMDWKLEKGDNAVIQDAEVVVGDWIRNNGNLPFDPIPAWLRKDIFTPAALGISVAESIKAFEKTFNTKAADDFRKVLPGLNNKKKLQDPNYSYAAASLLSNLAKIDIFDGKTTEEDKRLSSLKNETDRVLESAIKGDWKEIFGSAGETLSVTKDFLLKIPREYFQDLEVVDFYITDASALVFLAPVLDSGYPLSFVFKSEPDRFSIKRIDFINYSSFYNEFVQREIKKSEDNTK